MFAAYLFLKSPPLYLIEGDIVGALVLELRGAGAGLVAIEAAFLSVRPFLK